MSKLIYVLNGPNLNMLGKREPEIYGRETLDDVAGKCTDLANQLGLAIEFRQSNHEGELVDWIQQAGTEAAGVVINPAGYSHTSIAIYDAILAVEIPVIEVHLSNIYAREDFRHRSMVSHVATGAICGLGSQGYLLALRAIANLINK